MKRQLLVVAGLSILAVAGAGAQSQNCPAGTGPTDPRTVGQDGCQQAADLFQFMAPQLGLALVGGNATLGQGSTLGGFGHFSIGVRANVFQGSLPQVDQFTQSSSGAQSKTLPTKDQYLGLPTADAAIGILGGIPLGLTNILGVDALVSASYVPTYTSGTVSVTPSQNVQIGYGVRVGVIQESIVVPGISVTYLKRDLPTTTITGTSGNNSLAVNNLAASTTAYRVVVSKTLLLFSFAAGGGIDKYTSSANITANVNGSVFGVPVAGSGSVNGSQDLQRTNVFFDAALNLPLFKIVGEIGQASGGTVNTFNSFSSRADRSQQYFSAGLRLGL